MRRLHSFEVTRVCLVLVPATLPFRWHRYLRIVRKAVCGCELSRGRLFLLTLKHVIGSEAYPRVEEVGSRSLRLDGCRARVKRGREGGVSWVGIHGFPIGQRGVNRQTSPAQTPSLQRRRGE